MSNSSRHMIHSLGSSNSFGMLSLRAKVLWPMLIAEADDQGRFDARPQIVKWRVCQNVEEITLADVPQLLQAMADLAMVILYGDGQRYGQITKWWEYQRPNYARPSKYPAPEGWSDRWYYRDAKGIHSQGWDVSGGLSYAGDSGTGSGEGSGAPVVVEGLITPTPTPILDPTSLPLEPTLSAIWFDAIGQTGSAFLAEQVDVLGDEYDREWVIDAIKETVISTNGRPSVKYLIAILARWKNEGKGSKPKWEGKHTRPSAPGLTPEQEEMYRDTFVGSE